MRRFISNCFTAMGFLLVALGIALAGCAVDVNGYRSKGGDLPGSGKVKCYGACP